MQSKDKPEGIKSIPDDINLEELLLYFPKGECKVEIDGMHKRNSYYDLVDYKVRKGIHYIDASRNSFYHVLPEFMFHSFDRFDNLNNNEEIKRFESELGLQSQERDSALRFFAPIDLLLLHQKMEIRESSRWYTEKNQILFDILSLSDELTDKQKSNKFICQTIPFLPSCKYIRGNKLLLTMLLRKIFMDEGLKMDIHKKQKEFRDPNPRYNDSLDSILDSCYVGNVYDELVTIYDIHYWSDDECNEHFLEFIEDLEIYRQFIQDYMMSVEEILYFNISTDGDAIKLADEKSYYYMNYNTNI